MEEWGNIIVIVCLILFIVFMKYFLTAWKQQCCLGGLSKKNSRILRAAAERQASRSRARTVNNSRVNRPQIFGNIRSTNSGIANAGQLQLPPPSFEEALKCPTRVYVIDIEEDPPSYQHIFPGENLQNDKNVRSG